MPRQVKALARAPDSAAIAAAAAALREGRLVVFPTETLYGLAGDASSPAAVSELRRMLPEGPAASFTWHAPDRVRVADVLEIGGPLHRRLLSRLAPGPVRFLVPRPEAAARDVYSRLGVEPGVLDRAAGGEREFAARIPDHGAVRDLLARVPVPVAAARASAAGIGPGRSLGEAGAQRARELGVEVCLDDGPTALGKPATSIRLLASGGYEIAEVGALDERHIQRKVERVVLFVCTGNTCRSPMAEAIARHLVERERVTLVPTRVLSAGVGAYAGAPMTPEAEDALREMGIDPGRHRARELTRDLAAQAEAVFAMTASHARAVREADPASPVRLLDPEDGDIPDPVGRGPEVYRSTARRLKELVESRLRGLDASGPEQPP